MAVCSIFLLLRIKILRNRLDLP